MKITDINVECLGSFGDDLTVVNAARVSFHKESDYEYDMEKAERGISDKDTKLINYLAKHKHFSPFNHAFLSFRIKAPVFVARQLVKHKFLPWNEVSRRYVDEEPEFYFPDYWRAKSDNVKQGSSEEAVKVRDFEFGYEDFSIEDSINCSLKSYQNLLECGVCPEQARMVLPQNTMTEWVWSGTLGAFLEMLVLRLDKHTQAETRIVAEKIATTVSELFPVSFKARLDADSKTP